MRHQEGMGVKIITATIVVGVILFAAPSFIGSLKDVLDAGGNLHSIVSWANKMFSPESLLLAFITVVASAVFTHDHWWSWIRRKAGWPDYPPQLEILWPADSGERLDGAEELTVLLNVRNPSSTETLVNVQMILEWWMSEANYRDGAYPTRRDKPLQLQFRPEFSCTLEPRGVAKFRLCRMIKTGAESHHLTVLARDDGEKIDVGTGLFVFQVRARADNALASWDFYEIGVADYGVLKTRQNTAAVRRSS